MTGSPMQVALFAAGGVFAGLAYFGLLGRSVAALAAGNAGGWTMAAALFRVIVMGAVLAAAARNGSEPLLAAFAGVLIARAAVLRKQGTLP